MEDDVSCPSSSKLTTFVFLLSLAHEPDGVLGNPAATLESKSNMCPDITTGSSISSFISSFSTDGAAQYSPNCVITPNSLVGQSSDAHSTRTFSNMSCILSSLILLKKSKTDDGEDSIKPSMAEGTFFCFLFLLSILMFAPVSDKITIPPEITSFSVKSNEWADSSDDRNFTILLLMVSLCNFRNSLITWSHSNESLVVDDESRCLFLKDVIKTSLVQPIQFASLRNFISASNQLRPFKSSVSCSIVCVELDVSVG
mmetsp:Transcript_58706/g.70637  ORF Transcript_58706/g.70637 Transcript_58706/m.70637 type:complete len:256 (+) Transcript_58706:156-923(+)